MVSVQCSILHLHDHHNRQFSNASTFKIYHNAYLNNAKCHPIPTPPPPPILYGVLHMTYCTSMRVHVLSIYIHNLASSPGLLIGGPRREKEGLVSTACACAIIIQILNNPITSTVHMDTVCVHLWTLLG